MTYYVKLKYLILVLLFNHHAPEVVVEPVKPPVVVEAPAPAPAPPHVVVVEQPRETPADPVPAPLIPHRDYAAQVADLVNQERAAAGLPALRYDAELSRVALHKAQDMVQHRYFSHTSPIYGSPFEMMKNYGIRYTAAGENIAKGQRSPEQVMRDWMNSSGHRANILSSNFNTIGVGYHEGAWVQMFIRR